MQQSALNSPFHQAVQAIQQRNWPQVRHIIQRYGGDGDGAIAPSHSSELATLLDQVLAVLDEGDFHDRWDVAKLLVESGEWAIAPLIERLQDSDADPDLRWFVARMLGEVQPPQALTPLLTLLTTADEADLRDMAAIALAQFGAPAIAPLMDLMNNPDTRALAVRALAQMHQPDTLPALLAATGDTDATIREQALEALNCFPEGDSLPTLTQALEDPAAAVRKAAVRGVGLRANPAIAADLVPRLASRLYDLNLEVCAQAAIALGRCGTPDAVNHLVHPLRSPHTPLPLQVELVRTLGRMGTPAAIDALQALLLSPPPPVLEGPIYQEIIAGLARTEETALYPKIAQVLTQVLQSDHPACRYQPAHQALIVGLGQVGQEHHLDVLIQALATPDRNVQLHTVFALKRLGGDLARQRLQTALNDPNLDPALRHGITVALGEWVHP